MIQNPIQILPLSVGSYDFAVTLLLRALGKHAAELKLIGEDPSACYLHSLNKDSLIKNEREAAKGWAQTSCIDLKRLQYFVAEDSQTGQPLGVSGIYSVLPGYLAREGNERVEVAASIETPDFFWMGWTAVIEEMKGNGIGSLLMRHGIRLAREIAGKEQIIAPQWAILADAGAVGFYEKRGMTPLMPHGSGLIFTDPLVSVEALLV